MEDLFGISDSTMALLVYLLIEYKDTVQHTYWIWWANAYVSEVFKMAPISVQEVEQVLPIVGTLAIRIPQRNVPMQYVCKYWKASNDRGYPVLLYG